ncbi:ATP-dependent helicase [Romboutsia weinsteinii]|uniref:ATP-dependent helicase n=1 Tax=Romboutsia weinsteinii TaxID=2020949 RepID=A0A371J8G0_9FIRM|nr:DEAD/DEAH box helicase [Romboutsia weinsteinii]RDY29005.1 ATP-dependent helicase [Romboutsia weinsteinii]
MNFSKIQELIKHNTHPSRWKRGVVYFNSRFVDHVSVNIDNNIITFEGLVESEYDNEVYSTSISIDTSSYSIVGGNCTCEDCRSRSSSTTLFICKHLAGTSLQGIQTLKRDYAQNLITDFAPAKNIISYPTSPSKRLLQSLDTSRFDIVNLEVNLNVTSEHDINADFKIGNDKMYVLKSIREFSKARVNNTTLDYGKNFTYNPSIHYFSKEDTKIADIIEDYGINVSPYASNSYNSKFMDLGQSGFKRFLESLVNKEFNLNFYDTVYNPQIIHDRIPVLFDLNKNGNGISLTYHGDLPKPVTSKGDVLLFDGNLYILSPENYISYKNVYSMLNEFKEITFDNEDTKDVLSSLIPRLEELSTNINIDEEIKINTVSDFKPEFYFDLKNANIVCELKFAYDDNNGEKFILRDIPREKYFASKLESFNFAFLNRYYVFKGNDSDLFEFLNNNLEELKVLGDVYYSDKFKSRRVHNSSSLTASINQGSGGYLDFSFNISDIDKREYKDILTAFKSKSKFYKLKDGSFINLQESKTRDFLELVDTLDLVSNLKDTKIHKNKALFINEMLNTKNLSFINGSDTINDICNKFKELDKSNLKIPNELNGTLRDYQVSGLNWFNTLSHYEFGGILADEMGLGKTLQAIAFLCAHRNTKSLIVTPTSLIYNWKNEFDTFAPSMKVLLIHGNKKEREVSLNNIDDYDVIITTYGTLRNDLDFYSEKSFDYCIIDEAQNIKNPVALSTEAVKSIVARCKFALTGTPIENNLFELWSIFDFVMPGYLYSRSKFQKLFMNNAESADNLKKLIQPFVLRRSKKEVMIELPDKIEKKFFVDLNKDQRKIYSAYVDEIQEKMRDDKIKNDSITILSYLTKLRQLCLDPSVLVENYNKKSAKIEACLDILEESINNNHKILLFSQFTSVLKNIGNELHENNIEYYYLDGQTGAKERIELVNEFNTGDKIKVFLISLKAGGTGLNLTSADVVIHFDPWWNPSVENQASDRAHRFGQKNVVEVIKLIAKGTIEEKIVTLQESKKELIDEFINGDLSNGNILKSLSDKEIIGLFN